MIRPGYRASVENEAVIAANDGVEELDAEERMAFVQAQSDPAVFRAGTGVAAGVIVHNDDGGGAGDDRILAVK